MRIFAENQPIPNMADIKALEDFVTQVRRDILRQVHRVNSGHPGGSLGCAEFFTALYQGPIDCDARVHPRAAGAPRQ